MNIVIVRNILGSLVFLFTYSQMLAQNSGVNLRDSIQIDSLKAVAQEHHSWTVKHQNKEGMLDSAIFRTRLALSIRKEVYRNAEHLDLGKSLHNLGAFLDLSGNYKEAKKHLIEAVKVFEILNDKDRKLSSQLVLGRVYINEGEYVSAEEYFKLVINSAEKDNNLRRLRAAVVGLSAVYVSTKRLSDIILLSEKYQHHFKGNVYADQELNCNFYNNLGSAYLLRNDYDLAVANLKKASLYDQLNYKEQSKIFTNLAAAYRVMGDLENCYKSLKQSQSFAYESKNIAMQAYNHKGLAKYYQYVEKDTLALKEYRKAICLMIPSFMPENDFSNPEISHLYYVDRKIELRSYFTDKLRLLVAMDSSVHKHQNEIIELFKLGDALIDQMRNDHSEDDTKLFWRDEVFPFYEEAIIYCYKENALEDAFFFFEKCKSVLLLEGYSFNQALLKTPKETQEKYKVLKKIINDNRKSNTNNPSLGFIESQRNFELFLDSLSNDYPRLFNNYKDLFQLSLDDFQREYLVDSSSVFVHYFYGKENVFAFFISNNQYELIDLGASSHYDSIVSDLRNYFMHPSNIDNNFDEYKKLSNSLYEEVLGSYIDSSQKTLIIVPDGPFSLIPFESLVVSDIEADEALRYVIHDKVVRYCFSGSLLRRKDKISFLEDYDIVSFLPFSENEKLKNANFSGVHEDDFKLARDNGLKVKFYNSETANKENLSSINRGIPIIHFSSHGFQYENEEPEILLANSSISISEIFSSSIPSDLVFLSACETNLGENAYGEGIQSMARAFTFAGAKSVISSLWNIVASPNSKVVKQFYENISLSKPKYLALHEAKLAYLEDKTIPLFEKTPYYWSGLVYYGNDESIPFSQKSDHRNLLLFSFLLISSLLVWFGYRYSL